MYRSDPKLIQDCLRGDQNAWNTLVERYGRLVFSIPRRYGLSESDADEVFQNVFLNAFKALERLQDHTRLSSWLITTAHRESWRIGKRAQRYPDLDERIADVAAPEEDALLRWERQHAVREALTRLGGRCADLLAALFLDSDELGYEEIAERLGLKVGSIGPTRARCLEKLRRLIESTGMFRDASASAEAEHE